MQTSQQSSWNIALMQSIKRIQDAKPHGLTITYDVTENVSQADAERILRQYADSGKYGILWCNSTFPDALAAVRKDYPDYAFVVTGAGNKPMDTNGYWFDDYAQDSTYLMGINKRQDDEEQHPGRRRNVPLSQREHRRECLHCRRAVGQPKREGQNVNDPEAGWTRQEGQQVCQSSDRRWG